MLENYLTTSLKQIKKKWVLIFTSLTICYFYANHEPDPEEEITFYIANDNNENLFRIKIKRCFLNRYQNIYYSIKNGDIVSSISFNFPLYTFSGTPETSPYELIKQCNNQIDIVKSGAYEIININPMSYSEKTFSSHEIKTEKNDLIHIDGGRVKIDRLFFPNKRSKTYKTIIRYFNIQDKPANNPKNIGDLTHDSFLNHFNLYTPLNDHLELEYTIWTRFYNYKPIIEDAHASFHPNQCIEEIGYCVPNNPADIIYDAIQHQENLIDCNECIDALKANDKRVVDFFLHLSLR